MEFHEIGNTKVQGVLMENLFEGNVPLYIMAPAESKNSFYVLMEKFHQRSK